MWQQALGGRCQQLARIERPEGNYQRIADEVLKEKAKDIFDALTVISPPPRLNIYTPICVCEFEICIDPIEGLESAFAYPIRYRPYMAE